MPGEKLSYEKQEPAFLRRLRGDAPPDDGRHQIQRNRPKKARDADADDDQPTYVDEDSNNLSKEEYEALVAETKAEGGVELDPTAAEAAEKSKTEGKSQQLTEGSALPRKRKAIKIGGAKEDEPVPEAAASKKTKKPKKKKAIALSFDAEEA